MALLDFRERLFFGSREVDENLSVKPKKYSSSAGDLAAP